MEGSIPKKHLKKLYHGGKVENLENILKNNFDTSKIGDNMGLTYGEGIYFSENKKIARVYSNTDKVLEVNVYINSYELSKKYRADNRKDQKELVELRGKVKAQGYNSFESPPSGRKIDDTEIILFKEFLNDIVSMKLVNVKLKQSNPKSKREKLKSIGIGGKFSTFIEESDSAEDSDEDSEAEDSEAEDSDEDSEAEDSDEDSDEDTEGEDNNNYIENIKGIFWNGSGMQKLSFDIKELIACGMQGCVFRVEDSKKQTFAMKIEFTGNFKESIEHFQIIYSINEFKIFPKVYSMSFIKSNDLINQFADFMNNEYVTYNLKQNRNGIFVVYIMEMIEAVGDYQLIRKKPELESKLCMKIRILNKLGISHNDYNPENMLVDTDYNVYLIDFGKVTFRSEEIDLTVIKDGLNKFPKIIYSSCNKFRKVDCIVCNYSEGNKICCPYCNYIRTKVFGKCLKNVDDCFENERNSILLSLDLEYKSIFGHAVTVN